MNRKPYARHTKHRRCLGMIAIIATLLASTIGESMGANYPLEITQPRAGLTTANRYYKAYPGLEYNVRMAVIGGAYPFTYSLTTAPAGMTINASTGTITWPSPPAGGPYTVTARVVDQESTAQSVTWMVTVTTSGFLFLDPVNGIDSNGTLCTLGDAGTVTGTINNPFKHLRNIWCGSGTGSGTRGYAHKHTTEYQNYFIYFRGGTNTVTSATVYTDDGEVMPWSSSHPQVWLAYPGETPVIDYVSRSASPYFHFQDGKPYIDGLEVKNMSRYGFTGNGEGTVFRRLNMHGLGPVSGNDNQSFINTRSGAQGLYFVVQNCTFDDLDHGAAIKIYNKTKLLIEDNTISNVRDTLGSGSHEGISLKTDLIRPTVRANTITNVVARAIGGNGYSINVSTGQYEILFNNVYGCTSDCFQINQENATGVAYIYRNTFQGRVSVINATASTGPFYFSNNVIVNSDTGVVDKIRCEDNCSDTSRIVGTADLCGVPSAGIVDSRGFLTSTYSSYLGKAGFQITGLDFTPPQAPSNLVIR